MAHVLIMPRKGNTVESCIITEWKVKEGGAVTAETVVCEVETDKASFELDSGAAGTILKLLFGSGDEVPVLQPIAVIGAAGEDWQAALTAVSGECPLKSVEATRKAEEQKSNSPLPTPNQLVPSPQPLVPSPQPSTPISYSPAPIPQPLFPSPQSPLPTPNVPVSPRARSLAEKEALPLNTVRGTGPGGRIIERDVIAALSSRPLLTAAAKAAGKYSIPPVGSGLAGRVTAADMAAIPVQAAPQSSGDGFVETPVKGVRKIIAERMHRSLAESAQLTLNASSSVVKIQEYRSKNELKKITITDLILFAVSRTIKRFPYMNAHKSGDTIKTFERVHLGLAVDTPRGLTVPVIRNADLLSLEEISSEVKRLAAACRDGIVNPDELSGSTITVSNLGNFGITSFTPILNFPEVAILGVCGIEMKAAAISSGGNNAGFRFEPHIGFSLTINHEAVDGAPAARFLKELCETIANIDLLLEA